MKKTLLILALTAACLSAGCIPAQTEAPPQTNETQTPQSEEAPESGTATVTAEGRNCSAKLIYSTGETEERSPDALEVTAGKIKYTLDTYGASDEYGAPRLELVELDGWNIAALRSPRKDAADSLSLYYFTESTLQELYMPFSIPAENELTADPDDNCFCFTDERGETHRFRVAYDKYGGAYPFRLRNADYIEEPVVIVQDTALGKVSFSYTIYNRSDKGLVISSVNQVELFSGDNKKLSCTVMNPVYMGGGNYDNLSSIAKPFEFEVLEYPNFGIAAVRVPYPQNEADVPKQSLSLIYFDSEKMQLIEDGFYIPDIPYGSELRAYPEENAFELTDMDGSAKQFVVLPETAKLQPVTPQA